VGLAALIAAPEVARRIGCFDLVEQLGRGGFAPVWLAREVYEEIELRKVAVKLFEIVDDGRGDARARRAQIVEEAAALCRVEHPSVVRFHTLAIDEDKGVIGLVMELAAGRSLAQRIEAEGALPFDDTLAVGIAISSALAAVHRAGLVHRDVKPHNVIEAGARYKLIDFGIAAADAPITRVAPVRPRGPLVLDDLPLETLGSRLADVIGASGTATADNSVVPSGTIGYVDPCVMRDGASSVASSDLYALGVTLFECATGRLPSVIASPRGIDGGVLCGLASAPSLASCRPDLPPRFAAIVDALLKPAREERPPTAEAVEAELLRVRAEWEVTKASRRVQLLPGEALAMLRATLARTDRLLAAGDHAACVEVHAAALRDLLVGPLAGPGHEVAAAFLLAARTAVGLPDAAIAARDLRHLVSTALAAHQQLLETALGEPRRVSRYRRDDPSAAPQLLEQLSRAYMLGRRLEDGASGADVARYESTFQYELAIELYTRMNVAGTCPAFVARLAWIKTTRLSIPNGARAGWVLTSVLKELRDFEGAPPDLLAADAQAALDSAVDEVVDVLGVAAMKMQEDDVEGAIAACEQCIASLTTALDEADACRPVVEMLRAVAAKAPQCETRMRAASLLQRNLGSLLAMKW
jgi:serine/threonine protein kinase